MSPRKVRARKAKKRSLSPKMLSSFSKKLKTDENKVLASLPVVGNNHTFGAVSKRPPSTTRSSKLRPSGMIQLIKGGRGRFEKADWMMANQKIVTEDDLKKVLSNPKKTKALCQSLVEDKLSKKEDGLVAIQILELIDTLLARLPSSSHHEWREPFLKALLDAGAVDRILSVMEAHEGVKALQFCALTVLNLLHPRLLEHSNGLTIVVNAMLIFSSNYSIQYIGCKIIGTCCLFGLGQIDGILSIIRHDLALKALAITVQNFEDKAPAIIASKILAGITMRMWKMGKRKFPQYMEELPKPKPIPNRRRLEAIDETEEELTDVDADVDMEPDDVDVDEEYDCKQEEEEECDGEEEYDHEDEFEDGDCDEYECYV